MTEIRIRKVKGASGAGFDDICYIFFESGHFERPIMVLREYAFIEMLKEAGLKVKS